MVALVINLMLAFIGSTCLLVTLTMAPITGTNAQSQAYCNSTYTTICGANSPHIACPGVAVKNCTAFNTVQEVLMTDALKQVILSSHNNFRNAIAGGTLSPFPIATRMPTIQWDTELASFAKVHAMQCLFQHDKCRATQKYRYAGQNLYTASSGSTSATASSMNVTQAIINGLTAWWNEKSLAKATDIAKITSTAVPSIGHFTAMAQDKTDRIGCSGVTYKRFDGRFYWTSVILTCDYSYTNMLNKPVYVSGTTVASGCSTGRHATYRNLCSTAEVISPNP